MGGFVCMMGGGNIFFSHTLLYDVERFLFIPLAQEQDDGECCGGGVGDGDGVPDAIDAEDGRQDEEEGDDEDDLSGEGEEEGFSGLIHAGEEV